MEASHNERSSTETGSSYSKSWKSVAIIITVVLLIAMAVGVGVGVYMVQTSRDCAFNDIQHPDGSTVEGGCGSQKCTKGKWMLGNSSLCCEYKGAWYTVEGRTIDEEGNMIYNCEDENKNIIRCPQGFFMSYGSSQCFTLYKDETRNWEDAKSKCEEEDLRLAEPSDAVAVALRKDIRNNNPDIMVWLGAQGDGSSLVWQSNHTPVSKDNPLWRAGHPGDSDVQSNSCLALMAWLYYDAARPYLDENCNSKKYALCEMIIE